MERVEKVTVYTIMIIGIIMLFVAWAHIFYRYFLNSSLSWSEEFLRMSLVWFSLLSTTLLSKRSEHIGIVIFRNRMPERVQNFLLKVIRVLVLFICAVVVVVGLDLTLGSMSQLTAALRIPYSLIYAAIPVSFLIMLFYELAHIINKNFGEMKEI